MFCLSHFSVPTLLLGGEQKVMFFLFLRTGKAGEAAAGLDLAVLEPMGLVADHQVPADQGHLGLGPKQQLVGGDQDGGAVVGPEGGHLGHRVSHVDNLDTKRLNRSKEKKL